MVLGEIRNWMKTKGNGHGYEKIACRVQRITTGGYVEIQYWSEDHQRFQLTKVRSENLAPSKPDEREAFGRLGREKVWEN